ncbi:acetyl-CoA synthetase-like protein [Teratosphaeria nubilosa]|uniref:Acetyl-CoA synthetase-like protein n=1 Tax=Teratosphaeria nubilosa TaxID=161662 RepID=A0A6G1LG71_9PEZI|nr:acetyl-CoA synthetase-like protein [Teratosphaeria nubilosa]
MALAHDKPFDSVDEVICHRAISHASATLICYLTQKNELLTLTGADLEQLTRRTAKLYAKQLQQRGREVPCNVALVGQSNLEYYIAFLALQRLGVTTTFISPRLSHQGYEHLLKAAFCGAAIVAARSMSALQHVAARLDPEIALVPLIDMDAILEACSQSDSSMAITQMQSSEQQRFIIHSSGSTGLPKPVPLRPGSWLRQAQDIAGRMPRVDTLITLPLFHSFGLATLLRCLVGGRKLSIINADRPITATAIISALDATLSGALVTVPYVLKFFTETENGVARLAKLRQVIAAGSAIPDELGDQLVASGVRIFHLYGQTESGALMKPSSEHWDWVTPLPHAEPFLKFEPVDGDLYHLVVLPGLEAKVCSNREDGSYETKDLFRRHPKHSHLWKFAARHDDIIVLVNGEKADPIPIEQAVCQNPLVRFAVAFGAQQESLGLLVIASERAADMSPKDIIKSILPDLERGNLRVPGYAHIPRDGLIVKPAGTEVSCTDKGTAIRSRFLEQFREDIDAYYAARGGSIQSKDDRNATDLRESVRRAVRQVLQIDACGDNLLTDDGDFFDLNMDSLQASNVRARLARELGLQGLQTNLVFDYPTVDLLVQYLTSSLQGRADSADSRTKLAAELIERHSRFEMFMPSAPSTAEGESEEILQANGTSDHCIVVLTGATGFIGSHILQNLLQNPIVTQVHCLVRATDSSSAFDRIIESLRRHHILEQATTRLSKIQAHACNFAAPDLGLTPSLQSRMQESASHYIHNAWQVNFNLSLRSFETQSIRPTSILLSLASASKLKKKPSFTFISSIATALRMNDGASSVPEALLPWEAVEPMGYAESKYVGERICAAAATKHDLPIRIARVGQVCGDTVQGYWNPSEAIPRTVMMARRVGALPEIEKGDEELDWLPVDIVARAVSRLSLLESDPYGGEDPQVFHVTNKKRIGWNRHFLPALSAAGLKYDGVPARKWVELLAQRSAATMDQNPGTQLLEFWTSKYACSTARQTPIFDMARMARACPELGEGFEIGEELIRKFVSHWVMQE